MNTAAVRVVAVVALVAVAVVVVVLLLAGEPEHRYSFVFENAGQLVPDDDVQVGGRRIGSIKSIELTPDYKAKVTVSVSEPYAPLRDGTRASIRLTSLSGVANRYITLALAPENKPRLRDGAVIASANTQAPVDLDEVLDTFDKPTRKHLQALIHAFKTEYQGGGAPQGANAALKYLGPTVSSAARLAGRLSSDEPALTGFLVNSERTAAAINERRRDLIALIGNAERTFDALKADNNALRRAFAILPTTLKRANTTFVDLRYTLDDLDSLVAAAKPNTRELAPFLRRLRPLLAAARPTVRDLRRLVTRPGANNDLLDATRNLPGFTAAATPAFRHSVAALLKAQPVLEFARPYVPELVGWMHDFGQSTAAYDANGHYARVQPVFNAFGFTDNGAGGVLKLLDASLRKSGYQSGQLKHCPGGATQRPADGSSPIGVAGCDPRLTPPGP